MGEYFRGWRRKLGVVTLLMASAFAAGWVRSITTCDIFKGEFRGRRIGLVSAQMMIITNYDYYAPEKVGRSNSENIWPDVECSLQVDRDLSSILTVLEDGTKYTCHLNRGGFKFGELKDVREGDRDFWLFLPYWSFVVPLTLISAWLLLTKPRKSTQKKNDEPIAEKVG